MFVQVIIRLRFQFENNLYESVFLKVPKLHELLGPCHPIPTVYKEVWG